MERPSSARPSLVPLPLPPVPEPDEATRVGVSLPPLPLVGRADEVAAARAPRDA